MEPVDIGGGVTKNACVTSRKDAAVDDASGRPPVQKPPLLNGVDLQQVQVAEATPTKPPRPAGTRSIDQAVVASVG